MATVKEIAIVFKNANPKIKSNIRNLLTEERKNVLSDLKEHSPFDTGYFSSNWVVTVSRDSYGFVIKNKTKYSFFMEYGAEKERAPWFYRHRTKKGTYRKGTGKLKIKDGRVWAGGLNPGHSKTIGGPIFKTLFKTQKRLNKITKKYVDAVIVGIVK